MKHNFNQDYVYEGKIYKCVNGVIDIPVEIQNLNPIKPEVKSDKPDWKELAKSAGLEGDNLKKFMKKNADVKQKYLDNLKD